MNYGFNGFTRAKILSKRWVNDLLKFVTPTEKLDWDSYIQKTYILHLSEQKRRRRNLKWQLSKVKTKDGTLKDKVTWWEGLKGITKWDKKLHESFYSFFYHHQVDPYDNFGMSNEEMKSTMIECSVAETSITLSHIEILKDIVHNDIDYALIMEDDVFIKYDFAKRFKSIMEEQLPKDFDILYISSLPARKGFTWDPHSKDLLRLYNGVWWMSGIIVTKKAAQKLLDNLPIIGPIDVWINYQFDDMNVYMCEENLVEQRIDYESSNTYSFVELYESE